MMDRFSFSVEFIPSIYTTTEEVRGLVGDEVERCLQQYGFQSVGRGIENDYEEGIVVVVLVIKARCFFLSEKPSIVYNVLKRERERDRNSLVWANRFVIRGPRTSGSREW